MKKMLRYVLFAATLMLPAIAQAQDWRVASVEEDAGSIFFLDATSIRKGAASTRATIFLVLTTPEDGVSGIKADIEFECTSGNRRFLTLQSYDLEEQAEGSGDANPSWEKTAPDTQFEILWDTICGKTEIDTESYGAAPPFEAARAVRKERD